MRKYLFCTALFIVALLFSFNNSSAATNLELRVQTSENAITLNWVSDADYFQLYKGDKLVWEGTSKQKTIEELEPKKSYKYHLIALNKERKVVDQKLISVMTKDEIEKTNKAQLNSFSNLGQKQADDNPILDGKTIDAIVSEKNVKITWDKNLPENVDLYRNGEFIANITGHQFTDNDIEPNTYYTYNLVGKVERSDTEIEEEIQKLKKEGWTIDLKTLNEVSYESFDLGKIVKTFNTEQIKTQDVSLAATVYYPAKYNFRYTTFIPTAKADPPDGKSCPQFKGDNRDFSFSNNNYRTRTEVQANFTGSSNGSTSWVTKDVRPTTRYNCDGTTTTKTQKSYTMSKSNLEATKDFVSWKVTHSVGIPFEIYNISPPNIDYYYTAAVSSDGDIQVTGSHDQAPAHEMYAYIPNSDALLTIFRHENKGFDYLAPPMADRKISFSIYN
ncbi:DUF3238 domain-containing protein [Cytobacillus horneckiae]|nr:DUF3238 domain-containing protein [Cytobacillus horneckiae]MEC1155539.1 DUF3238 domain-containing protein [Cytobacillus horneckiae]MED2936858.1 DUF3238 domain-containing protein [Cytobacillus horneckiae]